MADGIIVTNPQDSGENSFRAAILAANTNPLITDIFFNVNEPIYLLSSIKYLGDQTLALFGQGVQINGSQSVEGDLFVSKTGASLLFNQMNFIQSPARMISIRIPLEATGIVSIFLKDITIQGASREGLYIADRTVLENEVFVGSKAGIQLYIENSHFIENGLQGAGGDGVRVIEYDDGSITAEIKNSIMNGNGHDGLDLAENNQGDMDVYIQNLEANNNGFINPESPEDGIDIDEVGEGDLHLFFKSVQTNSNGDEGMDIDEADEGHVFLTFRNVIGDKNGDESIRLDETGIGNIDATFFNVRSTENGDDGLQIRETEVGRLHLNFTHFNASRNEKNGVRIEQFASNDELDEGESEGWILNGGGIALDENTLEPFLLKGVVVRYWDIQ